MSNIEIQILKNRIAQLEKEIQEIDVLNTELSSLKPNATIYYQKTNTNIFFFADNKNLLKANKQEKHDKLMNELNKSKEELKKYELKRKK
ncbi:hypothetical protein F8M41_012925 [Gigaspora margarita]|uniref:Uncharacterized protein n=1 Tax=Gigaspora margarita TaxID=4874 RepID=A0A8H3WXC3_GIGMA|nr:hypothetical protein F8M41_012925 [Gigaspora margarita]